jgi:glycosyltransferase involved in cell wall biosynthesis
VQIEYHVMGQYLSALDGCPAPRVLIEHEPGAKVARELLRVHDGLARLPAFMDLLAWKRYERTILRAVQAIVVFTESDRRAVASLVRRTPVVRIPLGTELPAQPLNPAGAPPLSLVFVGNYNHPPNADAALRLMRTILPGVRQGFPELRAYIVGSHPTSEMQRIAGENVVITGGVADVTRYLDRAALVVAPLRLGGGMRVKILEAFAAGKAVVASPLAMEGFDLVGGDHVVLAETDQQFCDSITRLLADTERRISLAAHARSWADAHLSWEKSIAAYETLYEHLIQQSWETRPTR